MPKATVLKKNVWWDTKEYQEGDDIEYDLRDLSEMKMRHTLGEVQLDEAEAQLPPTSPPLPPLPEPKVKAPAQVMTTENTSALTSNLE